MLDTRGFQPGLGLCDVRFGGIAAGAGDNWEIGVSKTGYISEAGRCLVMQARVADKPVVIVLLDSAGKMTRVGDANRIKRWMESASVVADRRPV